MAYESIKVDIIPGAENAEVLHFSQYDNKRPFFIELFNGGAEFIPESGMSLTLECRKRDGNIVILSDPVLTDNVAEFSTTEQLTACYGDNNAEIRIVDSDGLDIGSANFTINVEKSPTCGGLVSESEIDNLTQQIEDITQQVIGNDYYNKTQTDALLANKANVSDLPDMTDYYTKTQTDNLLNDKADRSDLATLASKAEVTQAISDEDTSLKNWTSSNFATPGYVATHYYSKLQVDDLLFNMLPIGSASGNPCTFDTEIEAALQSLTANIVCGGGGGTPSTPIPIVGHSDINLNVNGQTFTVAFGQTVYGGTYDKAGRLTITHGYKTYNGSENWLRHSSDTTAWFYITETVFKNQTINILSNMFTYDERRWNVENSIWDIYNQIHIRPDSTISPSGQTDAGLAEFKAYLALHPLEVCVELATPIEIDVDAISPYAENGTNTIISDCIGDVNINYKDTIQHYIDSRI